MAIDFHCQCGQALQTDDEYAGRKIACPVCKTVLVIPAPQRVEAIRAVPPPRPTAPEPPEVAPRAAPPRAAATVPLPIPSVVPYPSGDDAPEDDSEEERQRRIDWKRTQYQRVARGLYLIWLKILLSFVLPLSFFVIGCCMCGGGSMLNSLGSLPSQGFGSGSGGMSLEAMRTAGRASQIISTLFSAGFSIGLPLLGVIGSILCCYVPVKTRARPRSIAALVCDVLPMTLSLGLFALARGDDIFGYMQRLDTALFFGAVILFGILPMMLLAALLYWIMFFLFLQRLARYLGEYASAEEAKSLLLMYIGMLIGFPVAIVGSIVGAQIMRVPTVGLIVVGVIGFVGLILGLMFFFRVLALISAVRKHLLDCSAPPIERPRAAPTYPELERPGAREAPRRDAPIPTMRPSQPPVSSDAVATRATALPPPLSTVLEPEIIDDEPPPTKKEPTAAELAIKAENKARFRELRQRIAACTKGFSYHWLRMTGMILIWAVSYLGDRAIGSMAFFEASDLPKAMSHDQRVELIQQFLNAWLSLLFGSVLGLQLLTSIPGIIGSLFITRVPVQIKAAGYFWVACLLDVLAVFVAGVGVAFYLVVMGEARVSNMQMLNLFLATLAGQVLMLASWIAFMLGCRKIGEFFNDSGIARECFETMQKGAFCIGGYLLCYVLLVFFSIFAPACCWLLGLSVAILAIFVFAIQNMLQVMNLIGAVSDLLDREAFV